MKKIIILAVVSIMLCSCGITTRNRIVTPLFLDFRPYTSADFFLSPNPYTGEFEPIGELNIRVEPAVKRYDPYTDTKFNDGIYSAKPTVVQEDIPEADLLELAVAEALKMGANGISNLKIEITKDLYGYTKGGIQKAIEVDVYHITGFCIARK